MRRARWRATDEVDARAIANLLADALDGAVWGDDHADHTLAMHAAMNLSRYARFDNARLYELVARAAFGRIAQLERVASGIELPERRRCPLLVRTIHSYDKSIR